MNNSNTINDKPASAGTSWSLMSAILAGCVVTLLGVARNLEPETILFRASVASLVMMCLSWFLTSMWRAISPPGDDD